MAEAFDALNPAWVGAQRCVQAQTWAMPNVFSLAKLLKQLIWTRMSGIGFDIDPLAVLISRVWTTAVDREEVRERAGDILECARRDFRGRCRRRHFASIPARRLMAADYLPAPGEVVSADDMAIATARETARFLLSNVHPYAHFVEVRKQGANEIVVADLSIEVGKEPVHDIRPVERVADGGAWGKGQFGR